MDFVDLVDLVGIGWGLILVFFVSSWFGLWFAGLLVLGVLYWWFLWT